MPYKENSRSESDVLRYQFTAFLDVALRRRRKDYILSQQARLERESTAARQETTWGVENGDAFLESLPVMDTLESTALMDALSALKERERFIFLERAVNETSFEVLAEKTGLTYQGAAAAYRRAIQKVKKKMEESNGI